MDKSKKAIFFTIIIFSIGVIFYNISPKLFSKYKINLEIKEMILSEGEYIVNKDIVAGYYDIEVIEGELLFNKRAMGKGSKIISEEFMNQNLILVEGTGKVKIAPSKFDELTLNDGLYKIGDSGNYKVGQSILSGDYKLTYICDNLEYKSKKPFIQIISSKDKSVIVSYEFEETDSYNISLKETEILRVNKGRFEDYKNYYIMLEVIE